MSFLHAGLPSRLSRLLSPLGRRTPTAARRLVLLAAVCGAAGAAVAGPREDFLAAERAIAGGDATRVRVLTERLADYPLVAYLELDWARRRLERLPDDAVAELLRRHADIPVAFRLRRAWLERLAKQRRWALIVAHHVDEPGVADDCRYAEALWRSGRAADAWQRVARLWPTARSLPDGCDAVLAGWRAAGGLSPELAWTRAALAVEAGHSRLARYLRRYLSEPDAALLERWSTLRERPQDVAAFVAAGGARTARGRRVVLDVVERAAHRDPRAAAALVRGLEQRALDDGLRAALRSAVGAALARAGHDGDLGWLDEATSPDALAWGAVSAMRSAQWERLLRAIAGMPAEERARERWRYWSAHAQHRLGQASGLERMRELAVQRSYYGFLAADRARTPYRLGHRALAVDEASVQRVARSSTARRAEELLALERPDDARREWQWLLARIEPELREAATLLAHRWGWHEAAIRAAAAARSWDDLEVRFPIPYRDAVASAARRSALPASRVYAVIRQESAFMRDIRSSAGALGLMQLLPATAREVARRAKLRRPRVRDLLEPERNVLLGSLYLSHLEQRYDGHLVLASAAYNAGPARVRRWRTRAERADARVWVETIPFRETRRYVRRVLAYQIVYAERLDEPPRRLSEMMPAVLQASR